MVDVVAVEVIGHRTVLLWFDDGSERIVDLEPFLWGPIFEEIARDDDVFRSVRADPEAGTIVWPNGADLAPEVLHGDHEPAVKGPLWKGHPSLDPEALILPMLTGEDRRSIALHRAIGAKLLADPVGVKTRAHRNLRRLLAKHPPVRRLLAEWRLILRRPASEVAELLVDPRECMCQLRQVTPFAGVLSQPERFEVYRQFRESESQRFDAPSTPSGAAGGTMSKSRDERAAELSRWADRVETQELKPADTAAANRDPRLAEAVDTLAEADLQDRDEAWR